MQTADLEEQSDRTGTTFCDYQLGKTLQSFGITTTVLLPASFLISSGNNIVTYNFARFATDDAKGRQVATGNRASCPGQQQDFSQNLVTKLPSRLTQLIIAGHTKYFSNN